MRLVFCLSLGVFRFFHCDHSLPVRSFDAVPASVQRSIELFVDAINGEIHVIPEIGGFQYFYVACH